MSNPCIAIGYISHTLTLVNLWYSKDIDTLGKLPSLCNITTNSATSLVPFTQWWSPTCFNNLQCQSPGKRIPVVTTYTTIFPTHQCHSLLCIPIMPLNHRSTTPITFPLQPHNYTARTECTHLSLSGYWPAPWNLFQKPEHMGAFIPLSNYLIHAKLDTNPSHCAQWKLANSLIAPRHVLDHVPLHRLLFSLQSPQIPSQFSINWPHNLYQTHPKTAIAPQNRRVKAANEPSYLRAAKGSARLF